MATDTAVDVDGAGGHAVGVEHRFGARVAHFRSAPAALLHELCGCAPGVRAAGVLSAAPEARHGASARAIRPGRGRRDGDRAARAVQRRPRAPGVRGRGVADKDGRLSHESAGYCAGGPALLAAAVCGAGAQALVAAPVARERPAR
eukprot:ctg_194.g127